ncbi:DUF739 family protein [uncultured Ruminococcus sp.]|uniref:DUF739 family protein n=1 Tax=uncultured Ruminococcus sp. TaxID=165186 RepID=UPI0025FA9E17|nr:DUF739 family protein [uncultured Ruminococcus sp.]
MELQFAYNKLRGRIREICDTDQRFAELMGVTNTTISAKLNGKSEFSQHEIFKAVEILDLDSSDISDYFFTPVVQKI